jgi:hypothetical protein
MRDGSSCEARQLRMSRKRCPRELTAPQKADNINNLL